MKKKKSRARGRTRMAELGYKQVVFYVQSDDQVSIELASKRHNCSISRFAMMAVLDAVHTTLHPTKPNPWRDRTGFLYGLDELPSEVPPKAPKRPRKKRPAKRDRSSTPNKP